MSKHVFDFIFILGVVLKQHKSHKSKPNVMIIKSNSFFDLCKQDREVNP